MATKVVDARAPEKAALPKMQAVIHVNYTDPDTENVYGGDFTIRRLPLDLIRKVALRRAELNGGIPEKSLAEDVVYLNAMLAHLEQAIVKAPDWWKPTEFYSTDIIVEVYSEVMKFENSFRRSLPGQESRAEEDSASQPSDG